MPDNLQFVLGDLRKVALDAAGFHDRTVFGGFDEYAWEELESRDLILVVR